MTDTIPAEFWRGVEQFNHGQFYDCHDTLEAIWMEAVAPDKAFLQGVLQISVALYHLGNLNWKGAVILLGEGTRRLVPYQPDYFGIDVEQLVDQSDRLLTTLQQGGPEHVGAIAAQIDPEVTRNSLETIADKPTSGVVERPTIKVLA